MVETKKLKCVDNATKEINLPSDLTHKKFFSSIRYFHEQVKDLKKVILDYSILKNRKCTKEFFALLYQNKEITEVTDSVYHQLEDFVSFKEAFELWMERKNKNSIFENFYKIELEDKIFLFGIFVDEWDAEGKVIAGYMLPNTTDNRLLIFSLSSKGISTIQEKTYRILYQ